MRPLQDQCDPTPYGDVEELFLSDVGSSINDLFVDFDRNPIGVASLAQVHVGTHRESGKQVAVKVKLSRIYLIEAVESYEQLQHPHLADFASIDMDMVEVTLGKFNTIYSASF